MTGSEPPPKPRLSHPAHTPPSGGPTRRSWLHRALSAMFATGIFLFDPEPASAQSCSDWFRCNQWGCLCSCLGGSDSSCPPGTVSGTGSWYMCCYDPRRNRAFIVRYIDCCTTGSAPPCPTGCRCANGPPQNNWCGTGSVVCTRAVLVGTC